MQKRTAALKANHRRGDHRRLRLAADALSALAAFGNYEVVRDAPGWRVVLRGSNITLGTFRNDALGRALRLLADVAHEEPCYLKQPARTRAYKERRRAARRCARGSPCGVAGISTAAIEHHPGSPE